MRPACDRDFYWFCLGGWINWNIFSDYIKDTCCRDPIDIWGEVSIETLCSRCGTVFITGTTAVQVRYPDDLRHVPLSARCRSKFGAA